MSTFLSTLKSASPFFLSTFLSAVIFFEFFFEYFFEYSGETQTYLVHIPGNHRLASLFINSWKNGLDFKL